jgi:hypothetical protein
MEDGGEVVNVKGAEATKRDIPWRTCLVLFFFLLTEKRKMYPDLNQKLERSWCYYCELDFDDLKIQEKHYGELLMRRRSFACRPVRRVVLSDWMKASSSSTMWH